MPKSTIENYCVVAIMEAIEYPVPFNMAKNQSIFDEDTCIDRIIFFMQVNLILLHKNLKV
jgi:hypothetical protein